MSGHKDIDEFAREMQGLITRHKNGEKVFEVSPVCFNYDLGRMKQAVEGGSITLPSGMTREERREWVMCRADAGDDEDEHF